MKKIVESVTRRTALGAFSVGAAPILHDSQRVPADTAQSRFSQNRKGAIPRSINDKLQELVSVKDFGAVGDGQTDDTRAIQTAFDSGARKVLFPAGVYLTDKLLVPDWLHIEGEAYQPGIGGDGRATELRFRLKSGAGLTCGLNPTIRHLFLQNTGGSYNENRNNLSGTSAQAIALSENAVIQDCCFSLWHECVRTGAATYYLKTSRLHFSRCNYGYRATASAPYNIHIDAPHSALTEVFLSGSDAALPRNVKIFGGSIEGYSRVAEHFADISFFGTYFETAPPRTNVIAIEPGAAGASVALFGCLIYMNSTSRFVNLAGLSQTMLTSHGNVFDGKGEPQGVCLYLPASGTASIAGDRFGNEHPIDCVYIDSIDSAGRFNITLPELPENNVQSAYSQIQFASPRGFLMHPLGVEPSRKIVGMTLLADGRLWDPLKRGANRPYWITWQGDRWSALSG